MKKMWENLKEIYKEQKALFFLMVILNLWMIVALVMGATMVFGQGITAKIGYSDIGVITNNEWGSLQTAGGYRYGNWMELLVFLGVILITGLGYSALVLKIYEKKNLDLIKGIMMAGVIVVLFAIVILSRLVTEG